jgi:hypothetical protein
VVFRFNTSAGKKRDDGTIPVYENWGGKVDNLVGQNGHVDPVQDDTAASAGSDVSTDWLDLAVKADDPEHPEMAAAQTAIKDACEAAGVDWDGAESWTHAATQLVEASAGGSPAEATPEPASADPEKGDLVGYKPPKVKKPVNECEVTAVFPGKQLVNLKAPDGTMYKQVAWDALIR